MERKDRKCKKIWTWRLTDCQRRNERNTEMMRSIRRLIITHFFQYEPPQIARTLESSTHGRQKPPKHHHKNIHYTRIHISKSLLLRYTNKTLHLDFNFLERPHPRFRDSWPSKILSKKHWTHSIITQMMPFALKPINGFKSSNGQSMLGRFVI